jgi:hypothetical protein
MPLPRDLSLDTLAIVGVGVYEQQNLPFPISHRGLYGKKNVPMASITEGTHCNANGSLYAACD